MPRTKDKFLKCVYRISFNNSDKVYVGSSMRWPYRKREHIHDLETQVHCNKYLQRAADSYGIKNISIEPIEFCDNYVDLLKKEQYWIDFYDSKNPKKGFNLVKIVEHNGTTGYKFTEEQRKNISKITKKRMEDKSERQKISDTVTKRIAKNPNAYGGKFIPKKFILYSPDNKKVNVYNLSKFCRDNDFHYPSMLRAYYGYIVEYRGWRCNPTRKSLIKKHFKFLSPNNCLVEIYGLRDFCLKNNLPYRTMCNIHDGVGISCRGWKKYYADNTIRTRKGKNYRIESPDGNIRNINNLKLFCRQHHIKYDTLRKIHEDTQGYKIL